jgi:glycosyltransferase involved in cell wall biosynthesis
MLITIAICTWNRARLLDQTLSQMQGLRVPPSVEWELIVVNNNCTDDTDEVLQRQAQHLPLRRLHEPKQGHTHARNCAVAATRGELLIWTDDDVLLEPDWLAHYADAAAQWPNASFFGGPVDPYFAVEPPRWIRQNLASLRDTWALIDGEPSVRPLRPGEHFHGANMAFRTKVMREFPFDTELGRSGNMLLSGDDTDMIWRLQKAGHKGVWVGPARVRHYIPAERLTLDYVRELHRQKGRASARAHPLPQCGYLWDAPRWALRAYVIERLKSCLLTPLGGSRWVSPFLRAARLKGYIQEIRALRRGGIRQAASAPANP